MPERKSGGGILESVVVECFDETVVISPVEKSCSFLNTTVEDVVELVVPKDSLPVGHTPSLTEKSDRCQ